MKPRIYGNPYRQLKAANLPKRQYQQIKGQTKAGHADDAMSDQISMFEGLDGTKAGDTTEDPNRVGRCLTWEEACAHIGRLVWYQTIMQSMTYWTAVIPEQRLHKAINFYRHNGEELIVEPSDRLICYDGTRQRLLIDEHFVTGKYKYPEGSAFYAMKEEL